MLGLSRRLFFLPAVAVAGLVAGAAVAQPAPAPARMCGGIAGLPCPSGQVCLLEGPPHPDQAGTCRPATSRTLCPHIYQPICGADGRTYPNRCIADSRGATVVHAGRCEGAPPPAAAPPARQQPDGERG